jgi:tetratricopeptide (TPR) repeat protein
MAYEKGMEEARKNRLPQARTYLEQAVGGFERYAAAWFELGTVRHRLSDVAGARAAYQRAIAVDAQFLRPLLQLAILASSERNWPETAALTERVLSRNRFEFPQAFLYHAAAKYNLGDLATAEKSVRRAIELDAPRRLPKAFQLLSLVLAARQEYTEAALHLQTYLKLAPGDPQIRQLRAELTRLESLASGANPSPPV